MLLRRCFASATAQARPNPMIAPIQQNTSRLPNGLTISSVDLQGPVSQLVFAFRSGSRYQQFDEGGLAHMLRNSIGTDSDHYLGLKLLWQTAATGSSLQSRVSKDLLCVHMSVSRTQAPVALSILGEIVQPAIKPWDILSVVRELEVDLKHQSATEKLIENLHRAAFRNGSLANPLLSASFEIGNDENIGFRKLQQYVLSRWKTAECALVGVNIDHSLLLEYAAEQSPIAEGRGHEANPSPFLGGDVRQPGPGQLAHVAVAGQGAKLSDEKAVAVQTVLCALIGQTGHYTGYNSIAQPGMVHKAVFKASNHSAFQLFPLNISHADNGLAGFHLVAEGSKINPYVKAAVQALRELANTSVNQDLLQIAKQTAEMEALLRSESGETLALDQAVQVLARGTAQTQEDFVKLVQAVSAEDVKKAASLLCAKLAMSAYGQIHQVPYADEL